ncbi:DedA family protein [Thiomicrorhabdus sp. ZW0627]|uniref:YqaA family protein n=1 Tax=Thiomicrorhabdus sp. ZW0627 TaxID=3039774 RepID=UPI002436761D|nr:DedA family protein [Thiomicrorhabdus sp. ZW0627]MDG6772942.1 DedA family protein [Thiomicrorhabdus sp. ZW0627]
MEAYLSLFAISFLAATLIPAASEVFLSSLLALDYDPFLLWFSATLGNSLGSVVNYLLGRYFLHYQDRKWFPFTVENLHRSQKWFQRYGVWSLLFSWAPVFGDLLTFIAGVMRVNLIVFTLLVVIGKGIRYAVLLGAFYWLT